LKQKLQCIVCNTMWGNGDDFGSSGICPNCFSIWVNAKKKLKGLRECYGEFEKHDDVDCINCTVSKICFKDTYGIE